MPKHFSVRLDPPGDGQCQFASVCDQLSTLGVRVSAEELRLSVVSFLAEKPLTADGTHMQRYTARGWSEYLDRMKLTRTYGDHLTLLAAARLYGVLFMVISSNGINSARIVPADADAELQCVQRTLFLGHYAEANKTVGEHYVSLKWKGTASDLTEFFQSFHKKHGHQPTEQHELQSSAGGDVTAVNGCFCKISKYLIFLILGLCLFSSAQWCASLELFTGANFLTACGQSMTYLMRSSLCNNAICTSGPCHAYIKTWAYTRSTNVFGTTNS